MTIARSFPYLRYNPDTVGDAGVLLAPPYDVVTPAERDRIAAASEWQAMRVELPEGGDATRSRDLLREWLRDDVLEAGEVGVAVVQQRFSGPDGVRRTRMSVACEVQLHDFSERRVLPHERTFDAPMRMRADLMDKAGANISPVFVLFNDPSVSLPDLFASVTDEEPDFTSTDADGTQTAVWFVTDVTLCEQFAAAVEPHDLLIADGHHRYTAALHHRDSVAARGPRLRVAGGADHSGLPHTSSSWEQGVLAMVANSAEPGICVFPTHRIVSGVDPALVDEFIVGSGALASQQFADDQLDEALAALDASDRPGFVVIGGGRPIRLLTVPDDLDLELAVPDHTDAYRHLDVVALHSLLLDGGAILAERARDGVSYTRSLQDAIDTVAADERSTLAFLMRSVPSDAIHAVAEAGELLPQKSTYYYPKVPTGVVYRALEPEVLGL